MYDGGHVWVLLEKTNCSNLNNYLFRNHTSDNPLCDLCGMVEDATHYFFHCRKLTIESQGINNTVRVFQPLSIDMILCGNFNLNMENNIVLFRAVHRYIHATKRFNTSWLFAWSFPWNIFCISISILMTNCSIPKLKGFMTVVLFLFLFFVFLIIQYYLLTYLFIYYSDVWVFLPSYIFYLHLFIYLFIYLLFLFYLFAYLFMYLCIYLFILIKSCLCYYLFYFDYNMLS